ncbi:mmoS [Asticcacaulis biprosthecium C19]|uniref:histidine kinase n=2 Tax=Asticcacaulis biprosthecium TaxID=76891 RepID=F4QUB1_9CAUL|nr:mmoS [Asticcacaulis biprosthecium C19]
MEAAIDWLRLSRRLGVAVCAIGLIALVGWPTDIVLLRSVLPGLMAMQPTTAMCLVLIGSVLALPGLPRALSLSACAVAALWSLAFLVEHLTGATSALDTLLFGDKILHQAPLPAHPGRMTEGTSLGLFLLSSLLLIHRVIGARLPAALHLLIATVPLAIGAISLLAYLLAVRSARGVVGYTDIDLHTSVGLCLLSCAVMALRPDATPLRVLAQAGSTGQLMRRILLTVVALPPVLGWTALQATNLNLLTPDFRLVLTTAGTMLGLIILGVVSARRMSESENRLESERLRAQASEAQFHSVIANAHQAIVTTDEHGRVASWNGQAEAVFGWSETEVVGRRMSDMIIPERFRDAHTKGMARFMETGEARVIGQRIELPALNRSGTEFTIELALSAARNSAGWQFTAMMHDVTERLAQTQLFEAAFHHAPIGVALVGLDGGFLKVNLAFCRLVDLEREDLLAADFQKITHPDDLDRDLELLAELTRGDIPSYQMDKRYLRPNGEVVWVNLSVSMVREETGAPKHYIAQVQNLTERMEAEARYQLMAENTTDLIVTCDLNLRRSFVSAAVRRLQGISPAEALACRPEDYMHEEDVASVVATFRRTAEGETGLRVRWRCWNQEAHIWTWVESSPSLIRNGDDTAPMFVDVVRDISSQVTQEQKLEAATDAAEAAAAAKADFMANMSHEIRTPLTVMIGFSSLLTERQDMPDDALRYAQRIATASNSLLSLVNDILDFSKLEAGQLELKPKPTEIVEMSRELFLMMQAQAAAKGLNLRFEDDNSVPDTVFLDPQAYRQVLLNLVGNAIKFTDTGSVTLMLGYDNKHLTVRVIDTGPGMNEAGQAKLFQRFSQVDGSSTRKHGGTGLGLAICRGLVEAMGGTIGVTSAPGEGSHFHFTLPAPALADGAAFEFDTDLPDLAGLRVLVVDDNSVNRELARAILERADAAVIEAEDGSAGVLMAGVYPLDVILMDIRMPGMDGTMAAKRIRSEPGPNRDVPILAFTANGHDLYNPADFDGLVAKPITPAALVNAIARAAGSESADMDQSLRA